MTRVNTFLWVLQLGLLVVLSGCGVASTPAPTPNVVVGDPVGLPGGGSSGIVRDAITPGVPFTFVVFIENRADETAVVDGFELIDQPLNLEVLGAAAFPGEPNGLELSVAMAVTPDLASGVEARPLVGSVIGPKVMAGWTNGGALVFILRVPVSGDYKASGVRLRYRVGNKAYETDIPATLEVCAGAVLAAGDACPFR